MANSERSFDDNADSDSKRHDGGDSEHESQSVSPWLGPITTASYLLEKAHEYYTASKIDGAAQVSHPRRLSSLKPILVSTAIFCAIAAIAHGLGWFKTEQHVMAVFTLVIAIIAAVQWWTTERQWGVMQQGITQTQESLELSRLQMRPQIAVTGAEVEPLQANYGISLTLTIENFGNSVANLRECQVIPVYGGFLAHRIQIDAIKKYGGTRKGSFDVQARIAPGNNFTYTYRAIHPLDPEDELTFERVEKIARDMTVRLYFVVFLRYNSPFTTNDEYVCTCRYCPDLGNKVVRIESSLEFTGRPRNRG